MQSLFGKFLWLLLVLPATVGGVIAVNHAFPQWMGKATQTEPQPSPQPTPQSVPQLPSTDVSDHIDSDELSAETQNITYTTINNYVTNTATHPVTEKTIEFDLSDITQDRILYLDGEKLKGFSEGEPGQVLQASGDGLPEWVDLGALSADWANPGVIGSSSPNAAVFTGATLSGLSTPLIVGSGSDFKVTDAGRVELSYNGDSGYLSSSGGAIFIDNTSNIGTGLGIYSDAAGDALGNMINVKVDNPLYNQAAFYMNYDGLSNAVEIVSNSSDSSSNALSVTGNNINDSTVGIIGYELAKGTIKVTHNRPGSGNDSSASGLSIDLKGVGTRAQGVYVDSTETGGTLGNLLRLRNESIDKFVVNYQGNLSMAGNFAQGANGTDTTFVKYGNIAGDEFFIGTNGAGRFQRALSNSEVFRAQIVGDINGRWVGTSDGRLRWGDGTNATDVTLRRIGTARLGVEGAITLNNLNADADTVIKGVSDSNLLYVDASANNIGIGTSGPANKLHVVTNTEDGGILVDAGSLSDFSRVVGVKTNSNSAIRFAAGESAYVPHFLVVGDSYAWDGGRMAFRYSNYTTFDAIVGENYEERMRIDSSGNIGIGTSTNLTAKLNIHGAVKTTSEGDIFSQFDGDSATTYPIFARYWDAHDTFPSSTFIFGNGTNSIVGIEKPGSSPVSLFRVRSDLSTFSGNVGIGTTSAGAPLHVFGGDIWLENGQALRIKDSGGSARSVLAYTGGNNVQLYNYASTGILQIGINNASNTGSIRFFTNNNVEQVRIDPAGLGVGATSFGTGADNVLAIAGSTAPSSSITDGIQLFAVDEGGSHELRVRDEAGNITTLSPHNFSVLPDGLSEPMAWSYYSERKGIAVSADMTKALRLVEDLSGVQLVYQKDLKTGEYLDVEKPVSSASIGESDQEWKSELQKYVSLESLATIVKWDDAVWQFLGSVVFKAKATFESTAVFLADVQIFGKLKVGEDTAGKVIIPAGATSVTVTFSEVYENIPLVYVTPVGEVFENFSISQITPAAFTINLKNAASSEIMFNWLAVVADEGGGTVEAHFPSPTPNVEFSQGEVAGDATESAEVKDIEEEASQSAEVSSSAEQNIL